MKKEFLNEKIETMSPEELRPIQEEKFLKQIDYVRKKQNMEPAQLGFEKLVVGAEPGGGVPAVKKRLQEEYQCLLSEGMGNSDAAPIIFGECPAQQGMHFCAQEYIFPELINYA